MFDCVIPVSRRDRFFVAKTIELLNKHVHPDRIFIVVQKNYIESIKKRLSRISDNVTVLNEDFIVEGLTLAHVTELLKKKYGSTVTGGWYFQQFIKMGFAISKHCVGDYLVWDADTLPIKPVKLTDNLGTKIFRVTNEHHAPYFQTIEKLLEIKYDEKMSFIAEYMYVHQQTMKALISDIIKKGKSDNSEWFDEIISKTDLLEYNSFSEYETYGTYVSTVSPGFYTCVHTKSNRNAGKYMSRLHKIGKYESRWDDFDIISLENQMSPEGFWGWVDKIVKIAIYINDKYIKIIK